MVVPTLAAAVLAWAGVLGAAAGRGVQQAAMIPAMLGVMFLRHQYYLHHHGSGPRCVSDWRWARERVYRGARAPRKD
jgi:hypothetical protein